MPSSKRLRAPLIVLSGMVIAVAFAGPASADEAYPPPAGTTVLGSTATAPDVDIAGVNASTGDLAFTGSNAIGLGAFGGLLLVGGGAMVIAGRRRKGNA
jgi:hypothetical protein